MQRPDNYLQGVSLGGTSTQSVSRRAVSSAPGHGTISRRGSGKVNMAYYGNWDIYARNYGKSETFTARPARFAHRFAFAPVPAGIPADKLTHLLYCFADIDPTTGAIVLTDSWADTDKHYDGDSWVETVRLYPKNRSDRH